MSIESTDGSAGGRIYFSNVRRSLETEDEVRLHSVGVDIGSSTSHLVFSRIVLERTDTRYLVAERIILHESQVMLTPYTDAGLIDAQALGEFIREQYALAGMSPDTIDTGALILTGVAVRRDNARSIGELFAQQTGQLVALSAGDALEATLAGFGSGAVARSLREGCRVMNIDVGGGTSKVAVCLSGQIEEITAIDIGARILRMDARGALVGIEPAGMRFASEVGLPLEMGAVPDAALLQCMVARMADRLFEAISATALSEATQSLLRIDPLGNQARPDVITLSGGVSEYAYERQTRQFGDLGLPLAQELMARLRAWGPRIEQPVEGIRATVVGASQYTVQVSGSTVYVQPAQALPVRNAAVARLDMDMSAPTLQAEHIAARVRASLRRLDLHEGDRAVALGYDLAGSATFARLDAFCRGVLDGMQTVIAAGHPLILVGESDLGGLIGIHCREERHHPGAIVSIDGISLGDLDFIDIGALLDTAGAVPVVIKSLVFPGNGALGRDSSSRPQ